MAWVDHGIEFVAREARMSRLNVGMDEPVVRGQRTADNEG